MNTNNCLELENLYIGDEIETLSGICGMVVKIDNQNITIEVNEELLTILNENIKTNFTQEMYNQNKRNTRINVLRKNYDEQLSKEVSNLAQDDDLLKCGNYITIKGGIIGVIVDVDKNNITIEVSEEKEKIVVSTQNISFLQAPIGYNKTENHFKSKLPYGEKITVSKPNDSKIAIVSGVGGFIAGIICLVFGINLYFDINYFTPDDEKYAIYFMMAIGVLGIAQFFYMVVLNNKRIIVYSDAIEIEQITNSNSSSSERIGFDLITGVEYKKNFDGERITIIGLGFKKKLFVSEGEKLRDCLLATKKAYDINKSI